MVTGRMSDPTLIPPPLPFTDRAWYAWLVLGVAMGLTAIGALVLQRAIVDIDAERFAITVDATQERILRRIETYGAMLSGVAGHIDGLSAIDRGAFAAQEDNNLSLNYPGILGIGWCVPVAPGDEPRTLELLAAQGQPEPRLWPEAVPGLPRHIVLQIEPDDADNRKLIGFDQASEPLRRTALAASLVSRRATVSAPLSLMRDVGQEENASVLVFIPVYGDGKQSDHLRGHVFAILRSAELFSPTFLPVIGSSLVLRIADAEGDSVIYNSVSENLGSHTAQRTLAVLGRTWNFSYTSRTAFDQRSNRWLVPLFTSAGLILSFGLFLLAHSQVRAVAKAAELYRISTNARRAGELSIAINRRLASTMHPQAAAQAVTEAGCELTAATFGAFFTTGERPGELAVFAQAGDPTPYLTGPGLPGIKALFATTLADQEVIRLDDVRAKDLPAVASYLAAVVRSRTGDMLGGLVFAHPRSSHFTVDHERLLLGLAAQAAIAFDNARLLEAEREARNIAGHRADDLGVANGELQQFIYVSSHDLQEPLRTITQYLDLLQRRHGTGLDDQARRYITYASDGASRMYLLLNDLLIYARLGHAADRAPVALVEVVGEVLQDLRRVISEARARIAIEALPTVHCDRAKIRSLFQNLIGNALKFRSAADPKITIGATSDAQGVWTVSVADNGLGILPEHREAVFEVFHRLHDRESFPGTGIGLAICRKVVEQHGGRIWIEPTVGGGATFLFTLSEDGSGSQTAIETP
jgi:signal transduction histidine kinase